MSSQRTKTIAIAVAASVAACTATATARPFKTIGTGKASGDYAVAQASGTVENPGIIRVKVTATPRQKVNVTWSMVCSQPGGGAGSKDGQFTARTTVTRTLSKPASRVTDCSVSALAQLPDGGKIRITLTG
jgi:hypothetical protein